MKHYFYLSFVIICLITNSCTVDPIDDPDDPDPVIVDPCGFDIFNLIGNTSLNINCIVDLKGQTVTLPSNINIDFAGGDIINGKLVFSGGYIDYRIMNSSLELEGDVKLKDPVFELITERWDIIEGEVDEQFAISNKKILKDLLNQVKSMQGTTFKIDDLDAYFDVGSEDRPIGYTDARNAIQIPGDFKLIMTDNTHIRVQPNIHRQYALMSITDGDSNVIVEGGNLYGDREEHDYNTISSTHEWGHVFMIAGATNVTLRGITMKYGTGDGLDIRANVNSNIQGHVSSTNILVEQCVFDSNRRNNVSITDGNDILVDNNLFLNAGIDMPNSLGAAPRYGLDVEELYFEEAYDITISNNIERGSANGSFLVAIGYDCIIENNTVETPMGFGISNGTIIRNNKCVANSENAAQGTAILCGRDDTDEIYNNQVYGNEIVGFSTGIYVEGKNTTFNDKVIKIYDNTITNCRSGMNIRGLVNSDIYNNTIESTNPESTGIRADRWLNDVTFNRNNKIDVKRQPFLFLNLNNTPQDVNHTFIVSGNSLNGTGTANINKTRGLMFSGNTMNTGVEVFDSSNLVFNSNQLSPVSSHGFHFRKVNTDVTVSGNTIEVGNGSYQCIQIDPTTNNNQILQNSNSCN